MTDTAAGRRIAIVTDAWAPQVNGVVRTLTMLTEHLASGGHVLEIVAPHRYPSVPCPTYPEIRLALAGAGRVGRALDAFGPDHLHIATEGPLGWAARRAARRRGWAFSTSVHTRFADYIAARTRLPAGLFWPVLRRFHGAAASTMVATDSFAETLRSRRFGNLRRWSRGVDLELFHPGAPAPPEFAELPRPIFLYVGRVAVEKNIAALLSLHLPGTTVVVGDGPARAGLTSAFPKTVFLGARFGAALAGCYAAADVMVFPSRTDTFGLVLLEALACGTPVAAFPVTGPKDVFALHPRAGALDEDLRTACLAALALNRGACRPAAEAFAWPDSARAFLSNLVPLAERRASRHVAASTTERR